MTQADKARFATALAGMGEVFDREIKIAVAEIYFRALERFSIDEVEAGISKACSSLRFFPKPVELIEAITGGGQNLEDKAHVEATKALGAVKNVGTYSTVVFDDPVSQAVIMQHFGGWYRLSELMAADEKWFLKDFAKAYASFARSGIKHFGSMPGLSSGSNALRGAKWEERPILVGDKDACRNVLALSGTGSETKCKTVNPRSFLRLLDREQDENTVQ